MITIQRVFNNKPISFFLQQNRLEDLFLIEEDAKDNEEEGGYAESETPAAELDVTQFPITAEIFVPPDGGYGWLIAFGAFNALFWTAGMIKSYGVIFDMILKTFPGTYTTLGVSPNFRSVACGLKFHWYLRTLGLKFQKARTKIEVFLSLPCWLSQLN